MAVVSLTATVRTSAGVYGSPGMGADLKMFVSTVEVGAADTTLSSYKMARLPSNARLSPTSRADWDDLASSGAPTVDIGIRGDGVTTDRDAIANGLDVTTAGGRALITDPANFGKRLWEAAGLTEDPTTHFDIYANLEDASVNVGGTFTLTLFYVVD